MIKRLFGNGLLEPSIFAFSLTLPCHSGHFHKGLSLHHTIPGKQRQLLPGREEVCVGATRQAEFFPPPHLLHPLGSASCGLCNLIQIPKVRDGLGAPREM